MGNASSALQGARLVSLKPIVLHAQLDISAIRANAFLTVPSEPTNQDLLARIALPPVLHVPLLPIVVYVPLDTIWSTINVCKIAQ